MTIIAANPATRDRLARYLGSVGAVSRATNALVVRDLDATTTAIVLFPDDFGDEEARSFLRRAHARHPDIVMVVVTQNVSSFHNDAAWDEPSSLIALPRPSFGWTILDAIRRRCGVQ